MKKVSIIFNTDKLGAKQFYEKSVQYFTKKGIKVLELGKLCEADFVIVIGGDGTLLRGSQKLIDFNKPIIAVNKGSLGFLTEIKEEEAFIMYDRVLNGEFEVEKRGFLEINFKGKVYYALNDAVISKNSVEVKLIKVDVFMDSDYVNTYRADGLIVATPTGSTAYSLSAGGPIMMPEIDSMILTPIAPHTLSMRPIVMSGNRKLQFKLSEDGRASSLMIDGQNRLKIEKNDSVEITMSKKFLNLVKPDSRNFYTVLREKLNWGDRLC